MKKITLLFILSLTFVTWSYGQCTTTSGGLYPSSTVTVLNNGTPETIANDNWPNAEVSQIEGLIVGNTYTISGNIAIYITVSETPSDFTSIGTIITHGSTSVSFTATTSEILIFWHLNALCGTQASGATITTIQCTSASCSCTATTAPGAVTNPTPTDGAPDVVLVGGGTVFEWDESLVGDTADSFTIYIGTTTAADEIGSLTNATSGNTITFGGADNTTYYWKIDAINCFGTTTSAVWSFNTIPCPDVAAPACPSVIAPVDTEPAATIMDDGNGSGQVNISWSPITGASGYEITFDGNVLGTTALTSINITGVDVSTAYTWSIAPENCFGTATTCSTWAFTTDSTLSVNEFKETSSINHFYNKATGELFLESNNNSFTNIAIFNMLGQQVISKKLSLPTETLNLSSLNNGIYIAKVNIDGNFQTIKFVKN